MARHHADAARLGAVGRGRQDRRGGNAAAFPDAAELLAGSARGIRHQHLLRHLYFATAGYRVVVRYRLGHVCDAGAACRRRAVSRNAAGAIAAGQSVHLARAALERIFLFFGGGIEPDGGFTGICGGVLHGGQPVWRVGTAGNQLPKFREHVVSVDFGSSDRAAGFHERGIYISALRHSIYRATHGFALAGGHCSRVLLELLAYQLPARATVHSRTRNRNDGNRHRHGVSALGHRGNADLALHI